MLEHVHYISTTPKIKSILFIKGNLFVIYKICASYYGTNYYKDNYYCEFISINQHLPTDTVLFINISNTIHVAT